MSSKKDIVSNKKEAIEKAPFYPNISKLCETLSVSRAQMFRYMRDDSRFKAVINRRIATKFDKDVYHSDPANSETGGKKPSQIHVRSKVTKKKTVKEPAYQPIVLPGRGGQGNPKYYTLEAKRSLCQRVNDAFIAGVSVREACDALNLTLSTYYTWTLDGTPSYDPICEQMHNEARKVVKQMSNDIMLASARKGLEKLIDERLYTETVKIGRADENGQMKPYQVQTKEKRQLPNIGGIRLALGSLDQDFKKTSEAKASEEDANIYGNRKKTQVELDNEIMAVQESLNINTK